MATANNMPLMLEGSMPVVDLHDVDDLFGDGDELAMPPSRSLHERMDELWNRGCCQEIVWSKAGVIASISTDGRSLQLRFLHAHPSTGDWALSEPTDCEVIATPRTSPTFAPLVHIAPAPTPSVDLAVFDIAGRVSIVSVSAAINRPFVSRRGEADPIDDLGAVVGCYWLPMIPSRQYNVLHGPAVRPDPTSSYHFQSTFVHASGPWHPNPTKSALLCLTTGGVLKMFYPQQRTGKYELAMLEMESPNASGDLITHASMISEKGSIYIAFATAAKNVRVIQVQISWGLPPQTEGKPVVLSPVMTEKRVAAASWPQTAPSDPPADSPLTQITHLELLPSASDRQSPTVLTVHSRVPTLNSPFQEPLSVIDRWTVGFDQRVTLSPAFEQLGGHKNGAGSDAKRPTARLQRLEPFAIHKVVIGVTSLQYGKVLCFASSDGSVQYHDCWTMEELYKKPSLDKVMNLVQLGFKFAHEAPSLQVAFSPNHFSLVQIGQDGELKWRPLHYPPGDIGNTKKDSPYSAIVAVFTLAAVSATYQVLNWDDLLAVARVFSDKPRFGADWVTDYIKTSKITVDYVSELHHDNLVRNSGLQSSLSIVNHLGFRGEHNPRTFSGKLAWLALSMRNIIIMVQIAYSPPVHPGMLHLNLNPFDEPEVIEALAGCVSWSLDLISWISDRIFSLLDDAKFSELLQQKLAGDVTRYLQAKNDVSLHLLLCSSTRGLLVALCRRLANFEVLAKRALDFFDSTQGSRSERQTQLRLAYQRMQAVTADAAVKPASFEALLEQFSSDVRDAYKDGLAKLVSHATSQAAHNQTLLQGKQLDERIVMMQAMLEAGLLLCQTPPPLLLPAVVRFFGVHVRAFRDGVETQKVFFRNYDLLEVTDVQADLDARRARGRHVDIVRRMETTPLAPMAASPSQSPLQSQSSAVSASVVVAAPQWRRCTRCAAIMEESTTKKPAASFVLSQRKCACSGLWALLPRGVAL